jgi:hypothetical protein
MPQNPDDRDGRSLTIESSSTPELSWRIHLVRSEPERLFAVVFCCIAAAAFVWALSHGILPTLIAVALLIGATQDYLFPISYRITADAVYASGPTSRFELRWEDVRRCITSPQGVLLTPLAAPSRLDNFRGVVLRFAPDGQFGDRATVMSAVDKLATNLLPSVTPTHQKQAGA